MKKYDVTIYLSTFYKLKIVANSESEAIEKARKLSNEKKEDILANLETWKEADEATEISDSDGE